MVPCSFAHNAVSTTKLKMYERYTTPINVIPLVYLYLSRKTSPLSSLMKSVSRRLISNGHIDEDGRFIGFNLELSYVITFLTSIFLVIFLRTGRRNLTRYEELDKDAQAHMNEELSWVMLCGLHQTIRSCVQILGMVLVTILFDILWFTWNTLQVYSSYASFLVLMMVTSLFVIGEHPG